MTGTRNVRKALLNALLEPSAAKKELQEKADFTALMALAEEEKTLPFGDIWNEYLERNGMSNSYINDIKDYEERITAERK